MTGPIGGYAVTNAPAFLNGVHTNGSNWLAADGHVKYLNGAKVSGGITATSATNTEAHSTTQNAGFAAGTGSMQQDTIANGEPIPRSS